jgi:hypothetical protein
LNDHDGTEPVITIDRNAHATIILAEIGRDMSRFPTAGHLLSWAGMCPGQNESAGKRKSSRLRKGDPWLKTILVQCAWARLAKGSVQQSWMEGQGEGATRKKDSYYGAQFKRLRARRGPKKAICAVAASMLTAISIWLIQDACFGVKWKVIR